MTNIVKSFKIGNKGEDIVIDIYTKKGRKCEKSNGKINHDLILDDTFYLEVKYDIMSKRTGNIAIEYHNSKKNTPSGISATKADFWVHIAFTKTGDRMVYIAPVSELKKWIADNKPKKVIIAGGDDNADLYIYGQDIAFGDGSPFKRIDI